MSVDFFIVISYILLLVLVGILHSNKAKSVRDFAVSSKTYGVFALTATISASFIGGGFSSGNASKAAINGIGSIAVMFGFSAGLFFVSAFLIPNMKKFEKASSTGEIMERAYGKGARVLTGVFSMAVCSGILGAQIGAIGHIFNVFLGISPAFGIIIGCTAVIIYSTVGGMSALVITDTIQFCILAFCMPLLLFLSLKSIGGINVFLQSVPKEHFNPLNAYSPFLLFETALALALGEILVPPCVQRLLMGNDLETTRKATFFSGVISVPFFIITGLIGMAGAVMFKNTTINMNSIMPFVVLKAAPLGVRGVIIAGMLSIAFSSADSFLNSASVGLAYDVIIPLMKKPPSGKGGLKLIMLINALTGVFAVAIAMAIPNLLDILIFSYSFWSPVMLVPLFSALIGIRASEKAFYISVFCAVFCVLLSAFLSSSLGAGEVIFGVFGSLMGFLCFKNV